MATLVMVMVRAMLIYALAARMTQMRDLAAGARSFQRCSTVLVIRCSMAVNDSLYGCWDPNITWTPWGCSQSSSSINENCGSCPMPLMCGPEVPHGHKDPTDDGFWNPPFCGAFQPDA